ncbi:FAD-dependent oxidoreductase [Lachnospiraceae bacterium]|jgi:2,4-dienoyl-CoA reductase-like NADH-dependent reductase (Old Yellow Enzyme family)/NADPH-dependent 2,4-dienoyl-CoA reductase/sulfur reductase-like enzyme|nr:FAD-dependent oxidoreductase [uncultured Schaedlerella sp.]MCI9152789.1 FAD-dependent oxidoreductase [Ruminococcus sp.]NBI59909.1 FAD-dependent oxidoreductase [Lachnospiraceae bacterium]
MKNKYFPSLADPITINGVTFKNRIFGAPMSNPELDPDCHMREEDIAFHANRGRGGLASVCIGLGIVEAVGRSHTKEVILYDDMSLPSLKRMANEFHKHNCKATMELAHGGKFGAARSHAAAEYTLIGPNDEVNAQGVPVKAMTEEQIKATAQAFGDAAKLVKEAGFDMVLIHGGHGWLLGQFASPYFNKRTDNWGGSLENRMRFSLLVIEKVREAVGPNFPIEFRMSGEECIPGGYDVNEAVEMAKMIDGKVDIIHVSAGIHENDDVFVITHPSMFIEHGCNVHLAAEIKKHVKTPVATLGGINDVDMMEEIIASGKADIVEVARQSLCDPYFPEKAFSGNKEDITQCCRCYSCFFNYLSNRNYCCAFNPVIGDELEHKYGFPATTPKKVVVVGGGPGGMEAAITAAKRGHSVALYEKNSRLGGQILHEQYIPFKKDMYHFIEVLAARCEKEGVEVHLNTEVTPEQVEAMGADVVISAVGAKPIVPDIPGIDSEKVVGLNALESKEPAIGRKVVILGGGLVGCEVAVYLDMIGKDVTIVEMKDTWAADAYWMHKVGMDKYIRDSRIKIQLQTTAKEVTGEGLLCDTPDGEILFEADTVLLAAGMKADRALADELYNTAPRVFEVGDAIRAGRVVDAVKVGYYRALDI